MKLKQITEFLETVAPLNYQESYDNSGLLIGDSGVTIKGILISLDCTEAVIAEAVKKKCNLIICHHPLIFGEIKKITGSNYVERCIALAIKKDIAIYAIHTNLDNVKHGVNAEICKRLGLINCQVLVPKENSIRKIAVFCPEKESGKVRNALFKAGAGQIGNYSECSFNSQGTGTFKGGEGTSPYVGNHLKQNQESEVKIECVYPKVKQDEIIQALLKHHPYEEVAYDISPIKNVNEAVGSGMLGELNKEVAPIAFLKQLKRLMKTDCIRYTSLGPEKVKKVAVCGGSGSFLLDAAIQQGADLLVTADFKYHQFFDADGRIIIADIGHYESEQFTKDLLVGIIKKKFPKFAVRLSEINTNPIKYL